MSDLPRRFGPYLLLQGLGSGGTGDVFLARAQDPRRNLPEPVVIKRLHGELLSRGNFVKRFAHEARIAVAVDSPHLPRVYDAGRVGDSFYIAMEHVAGWPLARIITDLREAERHASLDSVVSLIRGALEGLAALHEARHPDTGEPLGIVHRDVAPKNILLGEDGKTRLIDFGLGKSSLQDWKTSTGLVMGSPGYMAPEQVAALEVDARSDLYAMGIVLWELLTLERYIQRGPVPLMLRAQVAPEFRPPSALRPDVPPALDAVLAQALALDPRRRFESARAFMHALDAALPPPEEEPLATLVGALLWGELGRAKTEVTALLAIAPSPGPTPKAEFEVFAVRPGLPPPAATAPFEGREPEPRGLGPTATFGAPPEPDIPLIAPTPPSLPAPLPPPPRAGVSVPVVGALMATTLAAGLAAGAILLQREPVELRALEPVSPGVVPAAVPVEVAPRAVAPAEEPPETAQKAPAQVREGRRPLAPQEREAPSPEAPSDPRAALIGLIERARALRARTTAGSPEAEALTRLIGRLSMEASAKEVGASRVAELRRELSALERAGGGAP